MIEGGPPAALLRRGFTRDSLLAGTEVFVEGVPREERVAEGKRLALDRAWEYFCMSAGVDPI